MKAVGQTIAVAFLRSVVGMVATVAFVVLVLFTAWLLTFSCSRATILVSNQSGGAISNLVISGSRLAIIYFSPAAQWFQKNELNPRQDDRMPKV